MAGRRLRTVHLIRHAQSNWNVLTAGEHVGQHPDIVDIDSRLSILGAQQAASLSYALLATPRPQLIISSPLTRALRTAVALAKPGVPIRAEPLATEWCENSCDVGSPGLDLHLEFGGDGVDGLAELGNEWWPLTQAKIAAGGREKEASVDRRCVLLAATLRALPHTSVAVVSHCMFLQKLEEVLLAKEGGDEIGAEARSKGESYLGNAEMRVLQLV